MARLNGSPRRSMVGRPRRESHRCSSPPGTASSSRRSSPRSPQKTSPDPLGSSPKPPVATCPRRSAWACWDPSPRQADHRHRRSPREAAPRSSRHVPSRKCFCGELSPRPVGAEMRASRWEAPCYEALPRRDRGGATAMPRRVSSLAPGRKRRDLAFRG